MAHHQDFVSFMQSVVLPRKAANPDHLRLDGRRSGGNRDVVGIFCHHEKTWRVNADTHYETLDLAYWTALEGREPFVEEATKGGGECLALQAELQAARRSS